MTTPAAATAGHVKDSVEAALTALRHFEHALLESGFSEGAEAYGRMAEVVVAQFAWSADGSTDSAADFAAIGETASRIYGLLQPYTVAMRRLTVLAGARDVGDQAPEDESVPDRAAGGPDEADALAAVAEEIRRRGRRGILLTSLVRSAELDTSTVEEAVRRLEASGDIWVRGAGARRTVFDAALAPPGRAPREPRAEQARPARQRRG